MTIPMTMTNKLDMEYMNWYSDISYKTEIPDPITPGSLQQMEVAAKMMLNTKSKTAAFSMSGVMPGMPEKLNNCSYIKVPWLSNSQVLAACVKDSFSKDGFRPPAVPGMDIQGPTCKPVGDQDLWAIKIETDQKPQGKLSVTEDFILDKDMMFRSLDMSVKGDHMTSWGGLTTKDPPTPIGPSSDDLDFTKWGFGKCTEIPIGVSFMAQIAQTDIMRQVLMLAQSKPGAAMVVPLMMEQRLGMPPIPGGMPEWAKCFMPPAWRSKSNPTGIVTV